MRPVIYTPTDADRAICASIGDWHCAPEQRRVIFNHADTIIEAYTPTAEERAALAWVIEQDDAGNSAPYLAIHKLRYTFGATGYTGALAWLVEIVEARYAYALELAEAVRLRDAAKRAEPLTTEETQ